tara:strand:+ start:379 stop:621 length:243 start_codon:yes stop_codon:yes gene_type:complete
MKVFDFKKELEKKQLKYILMLSYIYAQKTGISKEESREIIQKMISNNNEKLFKNIVDNKYNKETLKDMDIEDILNKSIKD